MRLRALCVLTACCLSLNLGSTANCQDTPANANKVEGPLRVELKAAVTQRLDLHGAWVDLTRLSNGNYELALIVDSDEAIGKTQESALVGIGLKYLKESQFTKKVNRLPVHRFIDDLQEAMELRPLFGGAIVTDAYFTANADGKLVVNLVGRVANDDQRQEITSLSSELAHQLFDSVTSRGFLVKADPPDGKSAGVRLELPSESVAVRNFDLGVTSYIRRDYAMAYSYFTRARVDAPLQRPLQYWRVASLIGMQQDKKAATVLGILMELSGPTQDGLADPEILRSLERVQGPIRQRLLTMRNDLLTR